jgi:hypothetical protein
MNETQETITDWAKKTFGKCTVEASIRRMLKECKELEDKVDSGAATYQDLAEEIADIFITGHRALSEMNYVTDAIVNYKMEVNRNRKWKRNGDGTGQHVEEDGEKAADDMMKGLLKND